MPTKGTIEAVLLASLDHLSNANKDAAKVLLNEILNPPKKGRSKSKQGHV